MKKIIINSISLLIISFSLTFIGCKKDKIEPVPADLKVGDPFRGGVVAYILQSGDPGYGAKNKHGLIAAPNDQSQGIMWDNGTSIMTNASEKAIGSGKINTNKIISSHGNGDYAAKLCSDLVLNGYNDWYLPSIDELSVMYDNRIAIGNFDLNNVYWSSSESTIFSAWIHSFINENTDAPPKEDLFAVRAIRYF